MGQRLIPKVRDYQRRIADRHDDLATLRIRGRTPESGCFQPSVFGKGCHILKYSA